jgi:hypothetical protein
MSAIGTTRTFRNVRYSVAVGCKADIEQAASKMLDFADQPQLIAMGGWGRVEDVGNKRSAEWKDYWRNWSSAAANRRL